MVGRNKWRLYGSRLKFVFKFGEHNSSGISKDQFAYFRRFPRYKCDSICRFFGLYDLFYMIIDKLIDVAVNFCVNLLRLAIYNFLDASKQALSNDINKIKIKKL